MAGATVTGRVAWIRLALLVVAGGALVFCSRHVVALHCEQAPLHQYYTKATPADDAAVSQRMPIALIAVPIALAVTLLAVLGGRALCSWRAWVGVVAAVCLLAGLHGCYIWSRLPYGWGKGYEHVNTAQRSHLDMAMGVGRIGVDAALLLGAAALLPRFEAWEGSEPDGGGEEVWPRGLQTTRGVGGVPQRYTGPRAVIPAQAVIQASWGLPPGVRAGDDGRGGGDADRRGCRRRRRARRPDATACRALRRAGRRVLCVRPRRRHGE